jgi:dTDP-L-rhamnose 4-epimerase
MKKVLVTGGAGFIGSHLVDTLVRNGSEVVVIDDLHPSAHRGRPDYLNPSARYVWANVGDVSTLDETLSGVDTVYHLAALLGMVESQRDPVSFVRDNGLATATLLDRVGRMSRRIERFVVASSNTVYGEGPAQCARCSTVVLPGLRDPAALAKKQWEVLCPRCHGPVERKATPEEHPLRPASVYGLTKRDQEELSLLLLPPLGIPTIALRFFNVYGPRQSPTNPYAGVISIFRGKLLAGDRPPVYEDGMQTRDFVSVHDVVSALLLSGTRNGLPSQAINVGSGVPTPVLKVAEEVIRLSKQDVAPLILNTHRSVDIRHSFADISRARSVLGYAPKVSLEEGLSELFSGSTPG